MTTLHNEPPFELHIILRTCDRTNVHNDWRVRYCDLDKDELIKGCFRSLIRSIQNVTWFSVKLTVLDDHSSEQTLDFLREEGGVLSNFELISLEEAGYQNSALVQFKMARDTESDLVYCVEDDYLHIPSAIQEMVDTHFLFKQKLKRDDIVLYPFDAPETYDPPDEMVFVVHGTNRHWRTGSYTTNVLLSSPDLFKDNWDQFEVLAKNYNGNYVRRGNEDEIRYTEENTIWNIWRSGRAIRFNPIPSIALHMQFDKQADPYIDWKSWWEQYAV
jgi:glycosyltransferase involved in cell wall biosynthesis